MSDSEKKEAKMTVMCFFAADNSLSPLVISQLKAIKDAGFEQDTEVVVRFDPNESTVPTRIYHVNAKRRKTLNPNLDGKRTSIGDGRNPFVRNMSEDIIDAETIDSSLQRDSQDLKNELKGTEPLAADSLRNFVKYCLENHPARHYILFLVGHGMIVGNDAFLPDDHPKSGISLGDLESILQSFKKEDDEKTRLELLGLHSCSMSSVEIAYQLTGLANYMIASQGTTYVGSWPYRQLLKKIFATVDESKDDIDIETLVEKLYHLSLYNTTDFIMAGYSSEMSLCNLQQVNNLTGPLQYLITLLIDALNKSDQDLTKNLVISLIDRAHSEAQSYWGETYTDLYDFCSRLREACLAVNPANANPALKAIADAGQLVINELSTLDSPTQAARFQKLVVGSEYFGWKYQYSNGLSIYFPWSESLEVEDVPETPITAAPPPGQEERVPPASQRSVMERYEDYRFSDSFQKGSRWCDFLNAYFAATQRKLRNGTPKRSVLNKVEFASSGGLKTAREQAGALADIVAPDHKVGSEVGAGDCGCPSIKNFCTKPGPNGRKIKAFSISPGATKAFKTTETEPEIEPETESARVSVAGQRAG